jgi:hypothetical protein
MYIKNPRSFHHPALEHSLSHLKERPRHVWSISVAPHLRDFKPGFIPMKMADAGYGCEEIPTAPQTLESILTTFLCMHTGHLHCSIIVLQQCRLVCRIAVISIQRSHVTK